MATSFRIGLNGWAGRAERPIFPHIEGAIAAYRRVPRVFSKFPLSVCNVASVAFRIDPEDLQI